MDVTTPSDFTFAAVASVGTPELLRRLRDPAPPLAGVVFDLGGVLYDDSAWRRWLLKLVMRLGVHTTYTPFFRVWQREYLQCVKQGKLGYWEAFRKFLHAAGLSHGQVDELLVASQARFEELEEQVYPFPGVLHTLTRLKNRGIQLCVLSSGCMDQRAVRQQLQRLGMASLFSCVVASRDVESDGQSSFQVVVEQTQLASHQLGYVGCDTYALSEAAGSGMRTLAMNYDDDAEAEIYLGHFEQLLEVIAWQSARSKVG